MEYPFMYLDWDGGEYVTLTTNNVVEAIHRAWNHECDVFERKTGNIIFSGNEDNEGNSDWLEPYGIRMIDDPDGKYRVLQNIKTGEIYKPDWHS